MIKGLKLPLRIVNEQICDSSGKPILMVNENVKTLPLKKSQITELLYEATKILNKELGGKQLNENAQLGDKVLHKGQRGYIIGQTANGDYIVQVQGSTDFVKPSEVKVLGVKPKTIEPPFKFDEKTQKVLFEQYVKCGIFMGNTPVKTANCFVKYSDWKTAGLNENVNVFTDGELSIMPKENVRVFEDPNNFANPQDYVEGVIINEVNGEAIENVLINAIDYSGAIGSTENVRVIKGHKSGNPELINLSKAILRTLSV